MGLITFYDTETTDKWDFKAAWNASHQPHLVQIGFKTYDIKTREVVFEVGHLVNSSEYPTYEMSPEAAAVHGITHEAIVKYGLPPSTTCSLFQRWINRSRFAIAHNEQFDSRIMQCAFHRADWNPNFLGDDCKPFCTMMSSTKICKIPHPKGWNSFKWPSLKEAYEKHVDPKGFGGAHNALTDVNAMADFFWALVDKGHYIIHDNNIEVVENP